MKTILVLSPFLVVLQGWVKQETPAPANHPNQVSVA